MTPIPPIANDEEILTITINNKVHLLFEDYDPLKEAAKKALKLIKSNPIQNFSGSIHFVLKILTKPIKYGITTFQADQDKQVIFKIIIIKSLDKIDAIFDYNSKISYQFAKCFHVEIVTSLNYINAAILTKKFEPPTLKIHMHVSSIAALNYTYTKATPGTNSICIEISKLIISHTTNEDLELMTNQDYQKFIKRIKSRTIKLNDIVKYNFHI